LFLTRIDSQLSKLNNLVNSLLDISRINTGEIVYTDEIFNISDIVSEVVESIQASLSKHTIYLDGKTDIQVTGDKYHISQVVTNLLNNAIKFSPAADKIFVKIIQGTTEVSIAVQDFGVCLAKTEQTHIFDRFYQGSDDKRNRFPGGLGLGLYISREIVKRHNGKIWVESDGEGKGAVFQFTIPLVRGRLKETDMKTENLHSNGQRGQLNV
jgi:two-component system CheB/CheR fusion protein